MRDTKEKHGERRERGEDRERGRDLLILLLNGHTVPGFVRQSHLNAPFLACIGAADASLLLLLFLCVLGLEWQWMWMPSRRMIAWDVCKGGGCVQPTRHSCSSCSCLGPALSQLLLCSSQQHLQQHPHTVHPHCIHTRN
jgi:hypothetical protein